MDKLVWYWQGWEAQKKSKFMADARGGVMTISTYGHGGKVRTMMCFSMFNAWLIEMCQRFYVGYNIVHASWEPN